MNISLVLILIILFIGIVYYLHSESVEYFDFNVDHPRKKILFLAGTHGNEPAGAIALERLMKSKYFERMSRECNISIRVIPRVNPFGLRYGTRWTLNILHPDINRNYITHDNVEMGNEPTSSRVANLTRDYDLVIDFHEGWGFHVIDKSSLGSTLSPTRNISNLSESIVQKLNENIFDKSKIFTNLPQNTGTIPGTLSQIRTTLNKDYILVETSGQNDIQPLEIRILQVYSIISEVIKGYN